MNLFFVLAIMAADVVEPRIYTLEAPNNVWDVMVADMDQNGQKDLLLLVNDETAFPLRKEIAWYLADGDGGYAALPNGRLELPVEIGALFSAEMNGTPPVEIAAICGAGATVYQFTGQEFSVLKTVSFNSLYPSNSREPQFFKYGAIDLTEDGIDEWMVPTPKGLQVRTLEGEITTVPCDVVSEMRSGDSLYIVHRLPYFQTFKVEGEKNQSLAFLSDEFADFAYGENWSEQKRVRLPVNLEEKWDASTTMKDITGDGFPDLVVTQTRGTARMYAETHVYLAEAPFTYPEKPSAVFSSEGAFSSPMVMDINNDKLLDLVFIRIPFGVKNFINFFVRGKISIRAEVHLFDGKQFKKDADYSTSMTMDAPEGRSRVAYTFGDFNGDGLIDVTYGSEKDSLVIYTGDEKRFLSQRPWQDFNMPSFGTARNYSLNNNAAEDIVMFRPGSDQAKRVDVIVF